ncbi:MAG: hypothetical protein AB7R89_31520 [Dehalococcoidia bacterium]
MRNSVLAAGVVGALLIGLAMGCASPASVDAVPAEQPAVAQSTDAAIEGSVLALASSIRHIEGQSDEPPSVSVVLRTDGGVVTVIVAEQAQIRTVDGDNIPANEIPLSAEVRAEGRRLSATQFEATVIEVLP